MYAAVGLYKNVVIIFRVRRRRREMYIGHAHLCVCLSVAACQHYCTEGKGKARGREGEEGRRGMAPLRKFLDPRLINLPRFYDSCAIIITFVDLSKLIRM